MTNAKRRTLRSSTPKCFICSDPILYENLLRGQFQYRGRREQICSKCRGRYWEPVKQAAAFGLRYPFFERSSMPTWSSIGVYNTDGVYKHARFTQVFSILMLAQERQKILGKEVNWVIEDMTKKIVKLPDQIATIVAKTYAVCGDDCQLNDSEALIRIRDLLESIDPEIISRNKKKRLP